MSFQFFQWCLSQIPNATSPQRDVCYRINSVSTLSQKLCQHCFKIVSALSTPGQHSVNSISTVCQHCFIGKYQEVPPQEVLLGGTSWDFNVHQMLMFIKEHTVYEFMMNSWYLVYFSLCLSTRRCYYPLLPLDSCKNCPARTRSARARRACALRALGLLLADGAPTVGRGKTFWRVN